MVYSNRFCYLHKTKWQVSSVSLRKACIRDQSKLAKLARKDNEKKSHKRLKNKNKRKKYACVILMRELKNVLNCLNDKLNIHFTGQISSKIFQGKRENNPYLKLMGSLVDSFLRTNQ